MKNKAKKELAVCGFEAVKALAKIHPEKINRLYFDESHKFDFGEICRTLASRKAPYNIVKDAARSLTPLKSALGSNLSKHLVSIEPQFVIINL